MYVNYPNREGSNTYLYNDLRVEGTLTVSDNLYLGGSRIFMGHDLHCEAGDGALGDCPNRTWTFNRVILSNDHDDATQWFLRRLLARWCRRRCDCGRRR